jgi:hypothetical protein
MISSHVTYELGRTRIDDLRSRADESRRASRESDAPRRAKRTERRQSRQPLHAFGALRLRRA